MIDQQYEIDAGERIVYVTIAGDVSAETLHAIRDAVLADPRYAPGMSLCIEFRVLTTMPTPEEIRSLALRSVMQRANTRLGRIAIVATTARSYEAAGLFELYADAPGERIAIFTDPVAARAWLAAGDRSTAS